MLGKALVDFAMTLKGSAGEDDPRELRSKPSSGIDFAKVSSSTSKNVDAWQMRVVGRTMTGVRYFSERSNAAFIMAKPCSGVAGSRTGTFENAPKRRVSCSVWEEMGPGSSATKSTQPPFIPT